MEKRRQPEVIAGRVNLDGSIAAGDGFTVSKAASVYTVTFSPGFRLLSFAANESLGPNQFLISLSAFTDRSVAYTPINSVSGAATDRAIAFIAVGIQQ